MKKQLLGLVILAVLTLIACKQDATSTTPETSPDYAAFDKNVQTMRSFLKAHGDENFEALGGFLADTLKWSPPDYNGNKWLGKSDFLSVLKGYHDNFDNIKFTEGITIDGENINGMWSGSAFPKDDATDVPDVIRMYGTWTATHTETGKETGVKWFALGWLNEDGKISRLSDYFDVNGLAAQIAAE